ncbi:DUF4832 domain-containing protein [Leifsonia shinshuensis]|uniref:LamG-like jellyroll fold domain-containing protein n=1 Tax=Leifsonia shinshuensis TaxID=150026 RepID=UPI001F508DF8|nr:LamG-like jellyroll fold domain-containing protein [Leifsonia shinshuensis]MCI0158813.1 DUF4832 domain-containing protein [Leifsonia shinshuensis]
MRPRTALTAVIAAGALVGSIVVTAPAHAAGSISPSDASSLVTVRPTEISDTITNPGMGWVFIDNAIPGHNDEGRTGTYPDFSNVAVLSDWAELEPSPGVYNWSMVDNAISYWAAQGKRIHLRISTDTMVIYPYNYAKGAPGWLSSAPYNVGLQTRCDDATLTPPACLQPNGSAGFTYTVADYENPNYMTRLHSFMQAFGAHYDSNPAIDTVDLRGYGEWGEWHSGHDFSSIAARESTLQQIVHEWSTAFPDKVLNLSDSYEYRDGPNGVQPPTANASSYSQFLQWSAFDYALNNTPNVTFRRDGVAGGLHEYDAAGLQDAFRSPRRLPTTLEFYDGYPLPPGFPYTLSTRLDEAFRFHPNYLTVMGWDGDGGARAFADNEPAIIARANNNLGYRFVLTKASYPRSVMAGSTLELRQDWVNRAVGRAWKQYPLKVYLTDSAGTTVWSGTDSAFDQRDFVRGSSYPVSSRFTLPSTVPAGSYQLRIAMVDAAGNPAITLAIAGKDAQGRYPIGNIVVGSGAAATAPTESFEGGSFAGSSYTAGFGGTYGTVTSDPSKVVAGSYSAYGSTATTTDYYEFLYSDTSKIQLQPLTSYSVTFRYRPLAAPGSGGGYYFLARTGAGGNAHDVGATSWNDPADGVVRSKTVTFTTDAFGDYRLIWGLHNGGAMSVDDITIIDNARESFEGGSFAGSSYTAGFGGTYGTVTSDPSKVVAGSYSAYGSTATTTDYYEFLYSDTSKIQLQPLTSYSVTFRYRPLAAPGSGGGYYFLARTGAGGNAHDVGATSWNDPADGVVRSKTVTFTTDAFGDYRLIWGLHNGGAMSVDDITIIDNAKLADALAGQWSFDEGTGTTTASVDGAVVGTLAAGASWGAGRRGSGIALDGGSGYVALPNTAALQQVQAGDYTLSAQFKANSLPAGSGSANNADYGIVMKSGFNLGLYFDNQGHFHMVHLLSDGSSADAQSSSRYAPGGWHSVTGVVSKTLGTVDLYVDDVWQATARFTPGATARDYGTQGWNIGIGIPGGTSYRWAADGVVDDVRIWSKAVADTDVFAMDRGY